LKTTQKLQQKSNIDRNIKEDTTTRHFNKLHLIEIHKQIQPTNDHINNIETVIKNIETSLKTISDKMMKEEISLTDETSHSNCRLIGGIYRTGILVKGLILKDDFQFELIVLCLKRLSFSSFQQIGSELTILLNNSINNEKQIAKYTTEFTEEKFKKDGSIHVTAIFNTKSEETKDSYTFKLQFTCKNSDSDVENSETNVYLDEIHSRNGFLKLKQDEWFNNQLKPLYNAMLCLRIMRHLCNKTPTWSVLSNWQIEQLVKKCFIIHRYDDVGNKFLRLFELIASGVLFMNRSNIYFQVNATKLEDNDEKHILLFNDPLNSIDNNENVFHTLTDQQCEDITASGQHILRLITFKKIYQVLNIDKIVKKDKNNKKEEDVIKEEE
jgi:hypothetical protein